MKKLSNLLFLAMLVIFSSVLISCSEDDDGGGDNGILTPGNFAGEDFDSGIMIFNFGVGFRETMHKVWIMPEEFFGSTAQPQLHDYELYIDDVEYEVYTDDWSYFGWADVMLNEGQTYDIRYSIDGTERQNTLTIVYQPSNPFPDYYYPGQTTDLSWNLQADAQVQTIEGVSYYENPNTYEWEEDYKYKELDPSARSYTISADWLDDFNGNVQGYDLYLYEMNYKISSDTFYGSYSGVGNYYYTMPTEKTKTIDQKETILKLIELTK